MEGGWLPGFWVVRLFWTCELPINFITGFHDKHGTIDAYLADVLGVDDVAQERLRARLLET